MTNFVACLSFVLVNAKFPEGTVAGLYKAAVAAKPDYDCVRVDSQRINWSLKELDVSGANKMFTSISEMFARKQVAFSEL